MEINNSFNTVSSLNQQIALKKVELSNIDKKEDEKSLFEKNDSINLIGKNYDEEDYKRVLEKYKNLDAQVRTHEQTHAAGAPTTAPINYSYQVGPDGKVYASGGSVRFDTSIPKDEAAASVKLDKLSKAASGPAELSLADAQISRAANLNKLLLQNIEQGVDYANQ
jgi:hypothetical protein